MGLLSRWLVFKVSHLSQLIGWPNQTDTQADWNTFTDLITRKKVAIIYRCPIKKQNNKFRIQMLASNQTVQWGRVCSQESLSLEIILLLLANQKPFRKVVWFDKPLPQFSAHLSDSVGQHQTPNKIRIMIIIILYIYIFIQVIINIYNIHQLFVFVLPPDIFM